MTKSKTLILAAIGVIASVGIGIGIFNDYVTFFKMIWEWLDPLIGLLTFQVPLWIVLLQIVLVFVALIILIPRLRTVSSDKSTLLENKGQYYERFQNILVTAQKEILLTGLEKDWIFPLFLSLFTARNKGVAVKVIYYNDEHERHYLLKLLGCKVYRANPGVKESSFQAVIADPNEIFHCRAIIRNPREKGKDTYGRYYFGSHDYFAIRSLAILFERLKEESEERFADETHGEPQLEELKEDFLFQRLKRVKFYTNAELSLEEVNPFEVLPTSGFVVPFKLNQVREVLRIHKEEGWSLFKIYGVKLGNGNVSVVVPPVVEEHDGRFYLAEGHSRFYTARQMNIKSVIAVVVRGVKEPLPRRPTKWSLVEVADEKKDTRDIELARYIESHAHYGTWSRASQDEIEM
ncbi:MAG TPA: hypothetical protein PKA82_16865 [Pyrinomonadaceae bacterium]|nr:hypothetical protein [Pyrinomonadaceae bacterium]